VLTDYSYANIRRVVYGDERATFIPVCDICGRFVKADATIATNMEGAWIKGPNAECHKCGRVVMPFEGYV
jgi:hypothetical protein